MLRVENRTWAVRSNRRAGGLLRSAFPSAELANAAAFVSLQRMAMIDAEMMKGFLKESVQLTDECLRHLTEMEPDLARASEFTVVGNKVDRIMGAARMFDAMSPNPVLTLIADACQCMKKVAAYGAHVEKRAALYTETVKFTRDGVQNVQALLSRTDLPVEKIPANFKVSLTDAMTALITAYDGKPSEETLAQDDIDALFNKK